MDAKPKLDDREEVNPGYAQAGRFMGSSILYLLLVVCHFIWFVMFVLKIVFGALYIDDCSGKELLPVWLIVDAFLPIFFVVGLIPFYIDGISTTIRKCGRACLMFGAILLIGWAVCGAVFIYPNRSDDCNSVIRTFAKTAIGIKWGTIGIWGQIIFRVIFADICCKRNKTACQKRCPRTETQEYTKETI